MAEVNVQFLGTGDAFGSGGRLQTCFYVDAGAVRFLIDCGTSSLIALKRWGLSTSQIDVILLTHLHADHFGGVPFFLLDARVMAKRTKSLIIAGPPGLEPRIRQAQDVLFPGTPTMRLGFAIELIEIWDRKSTELGQLVVTPYQVEHGGGAPAYALRVECGGKVIAYSGDTEWTPALADAARGADLFICEANFFDKKVRYHMNYRTLMEHRDELDCKRLILTHMGEEMLSRIGSLEVEGAEDGQRIVL
jgi:ribonuclease BN (tRNA processing enzyme)